MGKAMMGLDARGMGLRKWLKPLTSEGDVGDEAVPAEAAKPAATTPEPLVAYMCQLGPEDMRSSKGERLTGLADVLAQDRANYHRYKIRHRRDLPDDDYFNSPEHRLLFSRVPVRVSPGVLKLINAGNATVVVTAYPDHIEVTTHTE